MERDIHMRRTMMTMLALAALAGQALAGPMSEFETALRDAYGSYRVALFATNSGKSEQSAKAIEAFAAKWNMLGDTWGQTPPPQYADDPQWLPTLVEVKRIVGEASGDIQAGKLPEAHEALEGIRGQIGQLHLRNGLVTFSDRTNAYHAAMEETLKIELSDLPNVHEHAAVLHYLAAEMLRFPPADASGSPEFAALSQAVEQSAAALLEAARSGDMEALAQARQALKPAYAKLFVKFG